MKKGIYLIFKCRNCGAVYEEKDGIGDCRKEYIGVKAHSVVSTHKCAAPAVYGCGELIGCKDYDEARAEK